MCFSALLVLLVTIVAVARPAAVTQLAVGNHFTVTWDGPQQAELAARALDSLDRAYWRIGQTLNTYPATPVGLVLYTTQEFRDITRAPAWAAGAYDGMIRVPMRGALARPEELDRVLAHEFTHALIHTLAERNVPAWLNEGLAAALERESIDWAREKVTRAGRTIPLTSLRASFGRLTGAEADLAYATSAIAATRLLGEVGGVGVSNLIRDLGDGQPFDAAFMHRVQRPFSEFAATLHEVN